VTRYELLERIGVGGMAEIFRGKAVAAGGFEKPVAIKRILPHLSQDKRFVELLIAEAKILSLLKHRNIVQIFDVGLGDDQQYFLVMEYVDGKDLGAVQRAFEARRRRMPFDLALHIGAEICEALEHAHTARAPDGKPMMLVHRDVSPSNVLLSRAGEIKLTDFGIAKRAEQEATGHGAVRGKFAYISPEQARNEHIDPRSDVFSVAILLWELVTSRRLFSGLGDLEALRAVRDAQVPRPLEVDPRLPPEIEPLLMAAFDRDIKRRPTAGELGAKLRSMRYSLDVTVGDPATELAKIIDTADEVQRESQQMMAQQVPPPRGAPRPAPGGASRSPQRSSGFEPEHTEATVIRIHTADAFQARDQDAGVARAREVIGRFDEEETRQAQLSGDQLRFLRSGARDSSDVAPLAAAPLPGVAAAGPRGGGAPRKRPPTDEPTTARPPMSMGDVAEPAIPDSFDLDESTVLVDRSRQAQLQAQPQVQAPPQRRSLAAAPPHMQPAPPGVMPMPTPMPGTVHNRNPLQPQPQPRGPTPGALPQTPAPFLEPHSASAGRGGASAAPMTLGRSPSVGGPPSPLQQAQGSMMPPPQGSHLPQPAMGMPPGPGQMIAPPGQMMAPPGQMMAPPGQMMAPPGIPGSYGGWGAAPPPPSRGGAPDMFQQRPSMPGMGFGQRRKQVLKPWMLVVGALVMAALAFVVTRAFLS
jgi:serine/threonine protein kinase